MSKGHEEKGKRSTGLGIAIGVVQIILSVIFLVLLIRLNILPIEYILTIAGITIVLCVAVILCQMKNRKGRIATRIVSVMCSIILIGGSAYAMKAYDTLESLNNVEIKLENMAVAVLASDNAVDIVDAVDYTFAIVDMEVAEDEENYYDTMIAELESQLDCCLEIVEYASLSEEITALENNEVDAIIYNDAYMVIVEEEYPDIVDAIKVIYEYGVEIELEVEEEEAEDESHVFAVYVSGIDTYGSITKTSRSDVNVIAVVNQDTEQILLISTPRDYYVTLSGVSGDSEDKLTHAGIYGVDVSVDTLEELYDMTIDYYVRVNFSSFITVVDALGGIEVYSSQSFYSTEHDGVGIYVEEGYNDFTGLEALLFARERYKLENGDYQRGENHEEIIKAIIEKVESPSIITGAYEILDSISDSIDTDMPIEFIQELIKTQIDEGTEWEVIMVTAEGTDGYAMCYSYAGGELAVVYPDEDSVLEITELVEEFYISGYSE